MSGRRSDSSLRIVFVVGALALVGLSVFSFIRVSSLIDASERVNHSHEVKLELEHAFRALVQAESAQRGYIHSKDSMFLVSYNDAIGRVFTHLDAVQLLTRDNSGQQVKINHLRGTISERLKLLKEVLEDADSVITPQRWLPGKRTMDEVVAQIQDIQEQEDNLMEARSSRLLRETALTPLFTFLLIIGLLIILSAAYFRLSRELDTSDSLRSMVEEREGKLRNQTAMLEEAQQLAHVGSWEWDITNDRIQWSEELYRIYGLEPDTVGDSNYNSIIKYVHPGDRDFVNEEIQKALKDQKPFSFTQRVVRPDGSQRILNSVGKVFADAQGKAVRMAGTAQDVTEQKNHEAELQMGEERFIKIFDRNPVAMTLTEIKANKIRFANQEFYSLFGYSSSEVIGRTSEELNLVPPEENARLIGIIMNILQETRSIEELRALSVKETEELLLKLKQSDALNGLEVLYAKKNGTTFSAIVSFEVLTFRNESFTITSYQDITDRKNAELLLKKKNEELEAMNRELESFTYISSHDLQEPLRKIQTFASRILQDEEKNLSSTGKEYFVRMQDAANRMQTLIADLLAYSRAGKSERRLERANLNEILNEVLEELKETIDEKRASVKSGDLGHANVILFQFRQLLHNLVGNALKFSKPGVSPNIAITRRDVKHDEVKDIVLSPGTYCQITVSDDGIGFEEKYKDQIFDLFTRLHDRNKVAGTGIGLAIVKKIAENHQGAITASGEMNKGATFNVYLPLS